MSDSVKHSTEIAGAAGLDSFFARLAARHPKESVVFICIGTDRSTGDSLGPLTGSMLMEKGFPHVIGTLADPCDADRFEGMLAAVPPDLTIVAIDACLGKPLHVGRFLLADGPLQPARSIGKPLAPVGAYSIAAIVNETGPKPYWTLQTTSLYRVIEMAKEISAAAARHWI